MNPRRSKSRTPRPDGAGAAGACLHARGGGGRDRIPDALFAEVQKAFSDGEIVELTLVIGLTGMLNLFNSALQVRYHDEYGVEQGAELVQ